MVKEKVQISATKGVLMVRKQIGDSEAGEFFLYLKCQMLLGIDLFPREPFLHG